MHCVADKAAIAVGSLEPVVAVSYLAPVDEWDSGFAVYFSDTHPDTGYDLEDTMLVCLHCLIEEVPDVGRGLDLARELGGVAVLGESGDWTAHEGRGL